MKYTYAGAKARNKTELVGTKRLLINGRYELEDIKEHSENLIDLIKCGDYVNGELVLATDNRVNDDGEKVILTANYDEWTDNGVVSNKYIKEVVTKELFNSIKYEVK